MEESNLTKKELAFIIGQGEGQFIEFKEKAEKSLSREIVAFSNSQGGRIFIGITDEGEVKGIKITNKLRSQITDTAKNCDPPITVALSSFEDKVLIVEVPEGGNKPYSNSQGFFVRLGANSQKLSRDEILSFSINEGRKTFDEELNENFTYPDDFDDEKLARYLKEAGLSPELDTPAILINLGVAREIGGKLKFNNAGILFFAREPSKFFLSSKVVCAEYATDEKVDILDRKIYDDGILDNIERAINFVKKHIKVGFEIKGARRKEIPQFPETAYREAVVNAIMHRDYFDKTSDVMVEVFRNRLSIYNPGGLVKWLKPSDFGKISKTRNPIIASLLARTDYVEKMGTGIRRMRDAVAEAGLPDIEFEYHEYAFYARMYREADVPEKFGEKYPEKYPRSPQETGEKTGEKIISVLKEKQDIDIDELLVMLSEMVGSGLVERVGRELVESQIKILLMVIETPRISKREMSEVIGISTTAIDKNIEKLKSLGVLRRVGTATGGHWEVVGE